MEIGRRTFLRVAGAGVAAGGLEGVLRIWRPDSGTPIAVFEP